MTAKSLSSLRRTPSAPPPSGRYILRAHPPGDLIITTLEGFFSLAQVAVYADAAERLIRQCSIAHGTYRILIDISGCAIQSQDVTAAFGRHVARVPRSRRVAVVTQSPMIRMQIRRIVGRAELAVFADGEDARSWLDAA